MIEVMNHDGSEVVHLSTVTDASNAEEATQILLNSLKDAAKVHGGEIIRVRTGVYWADGPYGWSEAYVVSEGATAKSVVSQAIDPFTVEFSNID
jgi:hypothetical protein